MYSRVLAKRRGRNAKLPADEPRGPQINFAVSGNGGPDFGSQVAPNVVACIVLMKLATVVPGVLLELP